MVPHVVEDEVVARAAVGEVPLCVVDEMVSADGADLFQVPRAAYGGYFGAERLGDLHREGSKASRRTVDQDFLTLRDLPLIAKKLEGRGCGYPDSCGFLKREVGRLRQEVIRRRTRKLGKGARAPAEDLVAGAELRHVLADRLDRPRDVRSRNPILWLAQPDPPPRDVRHAPHEDPSPTMDGTP